MTTRRRIVVVSAHFPPNFVSGGTLVPDRQARGLVERGWDVSVYAGHLDPSRPALATHDEVIDGLAVRWIEVNDFIGWSDPRNIDNPGVTADFVGYLRDARPDVVHFHSMQSLGAGLITEAKRFGARTVVTMHDFWWCCGRQFLVDRAWVPCSFAVEAGVCACEVDQEWRDRRHHKLLAVLDDVDLILAPSAIAAEVLAANGVPADRLEVDENGLPTVPDVRRHPRREGHVTFRYTGGAEPMKGIEVLRRAVALLAGTRGGWRLVAHGDLVRLREVGAWPVEAELAPSFPPGELDDLMSATDVLIVPSLARESHSLVTREALLRGVPVICSDSLGPEEVIEHGINGLVVPSGNPEALADALQLALDDPAQRDRWVAAAPRVRVRLESEQLDSLDGRLRRMLAEPPARTTPRSMGDDHGAVQRVLFICGIDGAPLRYRAHLPAEAMALAGVRSDVRHYRDPSIDDLVQQADAVVMYRVPATVQIVDLLGRLRHDRPDVPLVFDVDDLIFDPDIAVEVPALRALPAEEARLWLEGVRRYRTTMELCDGFVGSTATLCAHASAVTGLPAHRFANGVGLLLGRASDAALRRPRSAGPLRVGYLSGTTTHDGDWAMIEGAVLDALARHPGVELWLGGHINPSARADELGPRLRRLPMMEWRDLPSVLRDLDVNLAPLELPSRFNESKSAIKWLEAALCATPTVASPSEPFREIVSHESNGLLAATAGEWQSSIDQLLCDRLLRERLGARARRDALLRWAPRQQGMRYHDILVQVRREVATGRAERSSSWVPVMLDEPMTPTPLTPYEGTPSAAPPLRGTPLRRRVWAALMTRLRALLRTWRERGPRATAAATARTMRRDGRRVWAAMRRSR